jgi:hypothetical protein
MSETECVFCGKNIDMTCPITKRFNIGRCCDHHSHCGSWENSLEEYIQKQYD